MMARQSDLVEETVAAFQPDRHPCQQCSDRGNQHLWRTLQQTKSEKYFEINSVASFLMRQGSRTANGRHNQCGGSIINIGDWATVRPYLDHAAYFPSKGAQSKP